MAEIYQYYHKDDYIMFDIVIRSRSVETHSAISDLSEDEKEKIREELTLQARIIATYIQYKPK